MTSVVPQNASNKTSGFSHCHVSSRMWSLFRPFLCPQEAFPANPNVSSFKCDCPARLAVFAFACPQNRPPQNEFRANRYPQRHSAHQNSPFRGIDAATRWRYSQPQIPDLVAIAIPRFPQAAQSFRSDLPQLLRFPKKTNRFILVAKHPACPNPTLLNCTVLSVNMRPANKLPIAFPDAALSSSNRTTSTIKRRTGGPRFL
jgi:hypothetical protein